ncbi:MAG: hypothetical protein L0216_06435 [Planctomycetales bacterium]|nr:hypothetical protein [Planctomycetales bacterium]
MRLPRALAILLLCAALLPSPGGVRAQDPAPAAPKPQAAGDPDPALKRAIAGALGWLKRHQEPDGSWSAMDFSKRCLSGRCSGPAADAAYGPGLTGLALLAFLAAGNSLVAGESRELVKWAVEHLVKSQDEEGCVGVRTRSGHWIYGHAIATRALAETYERSGSPEKLREPVAKAVKFLVDARNPDRAWRYGVKPKDNDTSVTAWAVAALDSARTAGFEVPDDCFVGALKWGEVATMKKWGKTGYTQQGDNGARLPEAQAFLPSEAMTAAGLSIRLACGQKGSDDPVVLGVRLLMNLPPLWKPKDGNDFYYWYYGTVALSKLGGAEWRTWSKALKATLLPNQRKGGEPEGSWDPCDAWGTAGGRIYSTAINALTLGICQRTPPGGPKAR